ncbi:MAG: flavodoxin domain-containing protein [Bacteroidota bacterium]|nr:flavodoxin domain-containing protein [Bacteroidota bacterium]
MLTEPKLKAIQDLVHSSTREELIWINGYLSALLTDAKAEQAKSSVNKITIVYGTETGNSKKVATDFAAKAKQQNIQVKLSSLEQYRLNDLPKEEYLFVVISTQGEGEPPTGAKKFYDHIHHNGFKVEKLRYSVLALGDTSYPLFCKAGEDIDTQLAKLGGQRITPLQKCDVDFETAATEWLNQVLHLLKNGTSVHPLGTKANTVAISTKAKEKKIWKGNILSKVNLHAEGLERTTYHIELGADEVEYESGDTIGIVPPNPLHIVEEIIALTGIDPNKQIIYKKEEFSVKDLLHKKLSIQYLHERVVKKYADIVEQEIPETKMDLLQLLKIYPVKNELQFEDVLQVLNPQAPRLYNIASSPQVHSGEVHITVAKDDFEVNGNKLTGVASNYFSLLQENDSVEFFVQKNKRFRLPAPDKKVIMIGPGTGIAPFRSFLFERDATGATGENWLFFGEKKFTTDFLYQTEVQNWFQTGVLQKATVAFEEEQGASKKVHDKIKEKSTELFQWIQSGAYVYVCGEKDPMSVLVEDALLEVIMQEGKLSDEETLAYFTKLKDEGRYIKDVY